MKIIEKSKQRREELSGNRGRGEDEGEKQNTGEGGEFD